MKNALAILTLLTVTLFAFAMDDDLPNLQSPRFEVYTSGQPTEEGFQKVAAMGIKSIINVLPEKECLEAEGMMVKEKKMAYHQFPFEPTALKMETLQKFGKLLENQKRPLLIHCSTGNHVGGLWFAYRVLIERAHLGVALKEARAIGLKPQMEDAIFNWVVNQRENLDLPTATS